MVKVSADAPPVGLRAITETFLAENEKICDLSQALGLKHRSQLAFGCPFALLFRHRRTVTLQVTDNSSKNYFERMGQMTKLVSLCLLLVSGLFYLGCQKPGYYPISADLREPGTTGFRLPPRTVGPNTGTPDGRDSSQTPNGSSPDQGGGSLGGGLDPLNNTSGAPTGASEEENAAEPAPGSVTYVTGPLEPEVEKATRELAPKNPSQPTPDEQNSLSLAQSIVFLRVIRFIDLPPDRVGTSMARFGDKKAKISMQLENNGKLVDLEFLVILSLDSSNESTSNSTKKVYKFNGQTTANSVSYSLSGHFADEDKSDDNHDKSRGQFTLKSGNTEARILYQAHLAKVKIRESTNPSNQADSNTAHLTQLKRQLQNVTSVWVYDFVVALGRALYDNQFIIDSARVATSTSSSTLLGGISGPSLRTGVVSNPGENLKAREAHLIVGGSSKPGTSTGARPETPNTSSPAPTAPGVELGTEHNSGVTIALMGNSENHSRTFVVKPAGADPTNTAGLMLDIDGAEDEEGSVSSASGRPSSIADGARGSATPADFFSNDAFLPDDPSLQSDLALAFSHYDSNIRSPEVQAWIAALTGSAKNPPFLTSQSQRGAPNFEDKGAWKERFERFLENATPVRGLTRAIFNGFKQTAAFAYLTINESNYFQNGNYPIDLAPTSTAVGPFQFLKGTALSYNLLTDQNQKKGQRPAAWDERNYYATSACGAAQYFDYLTKLFIAKDATLALMAYRAGEGTVAGAVHCNQPTTQQTREEQKRCNSSTGRGSFGFDKSQMTGFIEQLSTYNYSFQDIARRRFLKEDYTRWVQKWLAYVEIGKNPAKYRLQNLPKVETSFNSGTLQIQLKDTAFPQAGLARIRDSDCRQIVEKYFSSKPN